MLQKSTELSAVLDRTMFCFYHSTTWLDQAQRKAPWPVRVKVRQQHHREERSAQLRGSSVERKREPGRLLAARGLGHLALAEACSCWGPVSASEEAPAEGLPRTTDRLPPFPPGTGGDTVADAQRWQRVWRLVRYTNLEGLELTSIPPSGNISVHKKIFTRLSQLLGSLELAPGYITAPGLNL